MILCWQQRYFMQANETPFASQFWHKELQKKNIQESILNGTCKVPEDIPLEAQEILREIKRPNNSPHNFTGKMTLHDFRDYI